MYMLIINVLYILYYFCMLCNMSVLNLKILKYKFNSIIHLQL